MINRRRGKKMKWRKQIIVHNEAFNDKWSLVEIGWQDLKRNISKELEQKNIDPYDPEKYILKLYDDDENQREIHFQIDKLLPENLEYDKLVFIGKVTRLSTKKYYLCGYLPDDLPEEIKGNEKVPVFYALYDNNHKFDSMHAIAYEYMTDWTDFKDKTNHLEADPHRPVIYQFNEKGDLWLRNYEIKICLHTKSDWQSPEGFEDSGYSGCSSYMVVENRDSNPYDILDIFNQKEKQYIQKKGMQVEKIELYLSDTKGNPRLFYPKDINYEIISIINGPVRASLVLRIPFYLDDVSPSSNLNKKKNNQKCWFYRCIYIYPGKYYVKEDIFTLGEKNKLLDFELDFCTSHSFTFGFRRYRGMNADTNAEIEDWFAFGDENPRFNPEKQIFENSLVAYGFASNCGKKLYESNLTNCHWTLKKNQHVHCLHKLLCPKNTHINYNNSPNFSENMGDEWYDVIYVNLWSDLSSGLEIK